MEHVEKMCTPSRRERQLEQGIRQNPINLVSRRSQEHGTPPVDQAPSSPEHMPVPARELSTKRNTLRKRRRRSDQVINPTNNERQVEAHTEATLNEQDATPNPSATYPPMNEQEAAKKPTWMRNWLGKFTNMSNSPSPHTPNSTRMLTFQRAQKTEPSQASPKSRRPDTRRASSKSLSSIFCFRPTPKPDFPLSSASPSTRPNSPTIPNAPITASPPLRPAMSPRASSFNIPRDTNNHATTTSAKRKRRSLTVHWRNSIPSTEEHLLEDQQETSGNKRSSRRDSAGIWNEAANDESEDEEEWYDADDPDRLLLENWSLHHRALVEDWQGN